MTGIAGHPCHRLVTPRSHRPPRSMSDLPRLALGSGGTGARPQARPSNASPVPSAPTRRMIAVIRAKSPYDGAHHAFAVSVMAEAATKGYAAARCKPTAPSDALERAQHPSQRSVHSVSAASARNWSTLVATPAGWVEPCRPRPLSHLGERGYSSGDGLMPPHAPAVRPTAARWCAVSRWPARCPATTRPSRARRR